MESILGTKEMYQISEVELVYRSKVKASQRPAVTGTKDAYNILLQAWNRDKIELIEEFKVLLLNRAGKVLGIYEVSTGGISGTVADLRLIFMAALKACAVSIILAHNHPSGNLIPSRADEKLTDKIRQAGAFLDIKVIDHLIIHSEGFYSFADEGLL